MLVIGYFVIGVGISVFSQMGLFISVLCMFQMMSFLFSECWECEMGVFIPLLEAARF